MAGPVIGTCEKCGTEKSYLYPYKNRMICKAAGCLEEETEHDSGKVEHDQKFLKDYKKIIGAVQT
jgi:hypothetical protein